ncbi:MAG: hypothetical protein ACE5GX_00075 [Thermoanaerobaculia bacterium]
MQWQFRLAGVVWIALGVGLPAQGIAAPSIELSGGTTRIRFNDHLISDLAISVGAVTATPETRDGFMAFTISESSILGLASPSSSYRGPLSGRLAHEGGFELFWAPDRISLVGFELHPGLPPNAFEMRAVDGSLVFVLDNPHIQQSADGKEVLFQNMDLRLSGQLAERLGRPELEGLALGEAHIRAGVTNREIDGSSAPGISRAGGTCVPDYGGPVDVLLESMTSVDEAHCDATRVALAPAVRLQNVGTADVKWFRSIAPDGTAPLNVVGQHPFLVMHLYRTFNGRIEQIGRSDVKHAFFSANTPPCDCQWDQVLFNDCTDLYGAGTNSNRRYLAPREEVTASSTDWATTWNKTGSHFDGPPPDDLRGHDDGDHADGFEHRLTAPVADLTIPGASYRVEAWYVVQEDIDIFNSMGHRAVLPTPPVPPPPPDPPGPWTFPFDDVSLTNGSALDTWLDPVAPPPNAANVTVTTNPDEGELKVAVIATQLPSGLTHYEYALMNFDFDRQIDSFTVPLPPGATVWNAWFGDQDGVTGNDWAATVNAGGITFSAPAGNELDWGIMYNFAFDANAAPGDLQLTLGVLETGSPMALTPTAVAPATLIPVSEIEVALAGSGAGQVTSDPAGIDCAGDCAEIFTDGIALELAATTAPGSAFVRWEEGAVRVSLDLVLDFAIGGNRDLTAVFETCQGDVALGPQTVETPTVFHACESLSAGAGFEVASEVIFRAGQLIALHNGLSVTTGNGFRVEIVPEQSASP